MLKGAVQQMKNNENLGKLYMELQKAKKKQQVTHMDRLAAKDKEIEYLKEQLEAKDSEIQNLTEMIQGRDDMNENVMAKDPEFEALVADWTAELEKEKKIGSGRNGQSE
ncbi:hypothetical protein CRE_01265 [Caenorhabditis remanei]|uniref:Uncharacterized protein n=1 Tax=Caenorhabditis remanei TaxID=31234 RepID=E3N9N1_CAERE|nr:hypothetical protein CRE_01265 [Caenorhabditis remanei]